MQKYPFFFDNENDIYVSLETSLSTSTVPSATTPLLERKFLDGNIHYTFPTIEKTVQSETPPLSPGDRVIFSPEVPPSIIEELGVSLHAPLIVWCIHDDASTIVERDKLTGQTFFPEGNTVSAIHVDTQMVIRAPYEAFIKVEVNMPLSPVGRPLDD